MNITQVTHSFIREQGQLREFLSLGLINHSALARLICQRLQLDAFDAVLMACRRFPAQEHRFRAQRKTAKELVQSAKLVLRTKIIVATVDKSNALQRALHLQQVVKKNKGDFRLIEGEETFSIITTEEYYSAVEESFGTALQEIARGLTQISMIFPAQITTTIGVCAYIYQLFAEHSINIRDEMSCWTDVMLIVASKDATKAVEILQN